MPESKALVYHHRQTIEFFFRRSMSQSPTPFEQFAAECRGSGVASALEHLADGLIQQQRFHELFEVRKIQLRKKLGLPVERWQAIDELDAQQGEALEKGLLSICSEVGRRFLEIGDVAHAWQYLEPVGDRQVVARGLRQLQVTDENVEALIEVSVGQGIEPELGFQLVLDRFGTCSAITTYESQVAPQSLQVRRGPARLLVRHLYEELTSRVAQAVQQQQAMPSTPPSRLIDLLQGREWLTEGLGHHIDTTHLASVVRISKILVDPPAIAEAIELAEYGMRLHEDFHYAGHVPFEQLYSDTLPFLLALAGDDQQAESVLTRLHNETTRLDGSGNLDAAVWYVYLLDRLGRGREAIQAYLQWVHSQQGDALASEDVCPNLGYLVGRYGHFELAGQRLMEQGDLLGFATVAAIESQPQQKKRPKSS